jgi:hypothetical protein
MKKILFFIILMSLSSSLGSSSPGNRPDASSWFANLHSRIINLEAELRDLEAGYKLRLAEEEAEKDEKIADWEAKRKEANLVFGLPFVSDTKGDFKDKIESARKDFIEETTEMRNDFTEDSSELNNEIENALATPPTSEDKEALKKVRPSTGSREALEVYFSCINLQGVIQLQIAEIRADPSNYQLAKDLYASQENLCKKVISMHSLFYSRIDSVYVPKIKSLITNARMVRRSARGSGMDEAIAKSEREKMEILEEKLSIGLDRLAEMKDELNDRIETLQGYLKTVSLLKRSATVAGDAEVVISTINQEFAQLDIPMPELLPYDLEESDFVIN